MQDQTFPGSEDFLEPIRKYAEEAGHRAGLDRRAVYNLCLAVDEIATNIVQHGYQEAGLSGNIKVGASVEDQKLVIWMEDQGRSYDPTKHEVPSAEKLASPLAGRSMGGLGILLARKGVDDLQYTSAAQANVHRFIVALPTATRIIEMDVEHRTSARGTKKLKTLLDFAKSLTQEIHLDKLPCAMIRELTAAMEAERSWVFLRDKQTGELISKPIEGMDFQEIRIPHGVCAAGWAAEQRAAINIPDSFSDPRFDPQFERIYGMVARSLLAVPMVNQNQELIGVVEVINKQGGGPFTSEDEEILQAICTYLGLALERAQMVQAYLDNQKMQQSLELALEIQMGLLPQKFPAFPQNPEIDICACVTPALEVGGDLYDFFMLDDDHIFFLIGDVSDKGIPAALFMAIVKTAFQIAAKGKVRMSKGGYRCVVSEEVPEIASVMRTVNNMLFENNPSQMFVTAFAGILDLRTGMIEYSDGGHEPPFIIRGDRKIEMLDKKGGVALGFLDDYVFLSGRIQLNPGDGLLLYTDGVNEARNIQNQMFARPAIGDTLRKISDVQSASTVVSTMLRKVQEFASGAPQSDDITLLSVQYRGRGDASVLVA